MTGESGPLLRFIFAREAIHVAREAGECPPWTDNEIFQHWSFTNIRREHDRVTRCIAENLTPAAHSGRGLIANIVLSAMKGQACDVTHSQRP
jgi:hypothetical protein